MGRKVLIICDLCKNETDGDFTKLSFKKPGKTKGLNYEVCSECSVKIQTQLVGDEPISLNWEFSTSNIAPEPERIEDPLVFDDDHFMMSVPI
jgi:hypothetical protein